MALKLGDTFPNFTAKTTIGEIDFHDWVTSEGWAILFSHPADYTPVCTTELGHANKKEVYDQFQAMGVKMIALSCDEVDSHKGWTKDILKYTGEPEFRFPIIADPKRELAEKFGMLDPEEKDSKGIPLTCRAVFIIGPGYKLKLSMLYPATTGRNFDEIIRVIKSLQLTVHKKVATPAQWNSGKECMVIPSVKKDEIPKLFPKGVRVQEMVSKKEYMRFTDDPSD